MGWNRRLRWNMLRENKTVGKAILVDTFPVRKYHIDTNNHVNNCQYVQMAMEVLREDMRIRQVRVEYKNQRFMEMLFCRRLPKKQAVPWWNFAIWRKDHTLW